MFNQAANYFVWSLKKITCLIDLPSAREECDVTGDPDLTGSRTPRTPSRWRASAASEARDGGAEQAGAGAGVGQDGERRVRERRVARDHRRVQDRGCMAKRVIHTDIHTPSLSLKYEEEDDDDDEGGGEDGDFRSTQMCVAKSSSCCLKSVLLRPFAWVHMTC